MLRKNSFVIFVTILILALAAGYFWRVENAPTSSTNNIATSAPIIVNSATNTITPSPRVSTPDPSLPDSFLIKNFPFQSQAPLGVWDALHNEACEEASVILVKYYLAGQSSITPQAMDSEILKLVDWQNQNWGGQQNLNAAQTLELAKNVYNLSGEVKTNVTIDDLKREIATGHPVIVPTAGQLLGNPNYRTPGPPYHMVVAIGYTAKTIIVQDVGTHNGDHYVFDEQVFYNAMHDWAGSESTISTGAKNILILN